ncbi:uncharacterized protein LOC129581442 [Paramacrobiotus metropolitanus]|uniref:uncharacterized protein LOC129581442 n=1 Tax=Paramacrobiotus metropolitanus TaxID=2943436 RepID=UPI002445EB90|nr:uncharacterized protein LOC129581442 [Paramacrobiotus metropolitanus]
MGRFQYIVMLISLLVYTALCDSRVSGKDGTSSSKNTSQSADSDNEVVAAKKSASAAVATAATSIPNSVAPTSTAKGQTSAGYESDEDEWEDKSSATDTTQSADIGLTNLTQPTITLPYASLQMQVFNTTSDRTPLFYAPAATLMPPEFARDPGSVSVSVESNTRCLRIIMKLCTPSSCTSSSNVRYYWDLYMNLAVGAYSRVFPLKLQWMLLGHSTNDSTPTITTSLWQPMTTIPPTASVRLCYPTDAAYNKQLTALRNDSAQFASRLFVSLAVTAPRVRTAPFCIDTKYLPNNTIVNAMAERFASGHNYIYMQSSEYASFTKTVVAASVEKMLGGDEFVEDVERDSLVSEMSAVFPFNTTTTKNFTADMWAATYWPTERPDIKARRLDSILGTNRIWVRQMVPYRFNFPAPRPLREAFYAAINNYEMYVSDEDFKVHLNPRPVYRVNLQVLRQDAPVCSGNISLTRRNSGYTGTVPLSVGGKIVFDDGTTL